MVTNVYTLKEFEKLERQHIFEGVITQLDPLRCNTDTVATSCCGKIKQANYKRIGNGFACKTAKEALVLCINSTKAICSGCEEHVFKKYQEQVGRL